MRLAIAVPQAPAPITIFFDMTRISYLNGRFLDHDEAFVHIEDRGFQFGDGVYEVILLHKGKLIDAKPHLDRLFLSLDKINIKHNLIQGEIEKNAMELFLRNNLSDGFVYMQVTRGAHRRIPNHPQGLEPTVVMTVAAPKEYSEADFERGLSLMTHEDIRWQRCDIKSVALIASSMINQKAKDLGFDDAVFVRDGVVCEGTYSNFFVVKDGVLRTKKADNRILEGITRNRLIDLARGAGFEVVEDDFGVREVLAADEVFLTSSTLGVRPVVRIDGEAIGGGKVGEVTRRMRRVYNEFLEG